MPASPVPSAEPRRRSWAQWSNLALVVIGVLVVAYGLVALGSGKVSCRGVEMHPGDVCTKSSFTDLRSTETQTYEQRRHAMELSRPVVVGSGLVLAGFGAFLYRRQGGSRGSVSADEERLLARH